MPFAIDSCSPRSLRQCSLLVLSSSSGSKSERDGPGPGPWTVWELRRLRRSSRTHYHVARLHLPWVFLDVWGSQELWKDCRGCSNPLQIGTVNDSHQGEYIGHVSSIIPQFALLYLGCLEQLGRVPKTLLSSCHFNEGQRLSFLFL